MVCRMPRGITSVRAPATSQELAQRAQALRRFAPFTDEDLTGLPGQRLVLRAGQHFLKAGEQASEVVLVLSGALREYYVLPDGSERTRNFGLPGDFAGSLDDLLSNGPSKVWIVAEQDTVLITSSWLLYQRLVATHPMWTRFSRVMAERLYQIKAQREYELLALDAQARYRAALSRWPQLEALYTQRDIASYIGVTPVHLSRLRSAGRPKKLARAPGKPPAIPRTERARRA